jgi:uncharacterized protein (DUF1501 family)
MQRRHLFPAALGAAAALGFGGRVLAAAPAETPRLLVVFLRGGYDATSLLVPVSSFYREVRPNIAIVASAAGKGPLPLTADWGLHPALEASVLPLVARRQACFVPFAGTDDLTRSHFETQDTIELGQGIGGRREFGSGFLNRLATVLRGREDGYDAIAFTDQLPVVMRGALSVANLSLKNDPKRGDDRLRTALSTMYRGHALQGRVEEAFDVRDEAVRDIAAAASAAAPAGAMAPNGMAGEMQAANRNAINAKGFELEARRIARLMRERYALGFVDVGGWDTHVGQGAATGYLASRFEELGRGLAAYADELGEATWRRTVVVVLSEFGRTARENGNRGTDHGHGSVHWVMGGGLASGPVAGEQQAVEARTLFQNRDWPVLNEYRAWLGGVLVRQFALTPAQLDTVFPGVRARDLGLV